jgi:hypothetical protein
MFPDQTRVLPVSLDRCWLWKKYLRINRENEPAVFVSAQRLGEIFLLIVCFYMDSELRKISAYTSRALRYLTDSTAQCVTGTQEFSLGVGSRWSCSNRRSNKTHWSCFYPSSKSEFFSFSLVIVGSSTASTSSSHSAYTAAFGFSSSQLAKSLMQQQL